MAIASRLPLILDPDPYFGSIFERDFFTMKENLSRAAGLIARDPLMLRELAYSASSIPSKYVFSINT